MVPPLELGVITERAPWLPTINLAFYATVHALFPRLFMLFLLSDLWRWSTRL